MNKTLFKTNSPEVDQSMEMFHSSTNKKPVLASSMEQDKKQKKQPASKNNNKPLLMKPVYKARKHEFF
jgi:hypothetical protein